LFDPDEYAPFAEQGTASISGQAFLRTRGGDVKYGAGSRVTAEPLTTYSQNWLGRAGAGTRPPHPAVRKYRRETIADAEGRFSFTNLPAGKWLVLSEVTWEVVTSRYSSSTTGGPVGAMVELGEGEEKSVVLQNMGK
jgi:hypothetical protein